MGCNQQQRARVFEKEEVHPCTRVILISIQFFISLSFTAYQYILKFDGHAWTVERGGGGHKLSPIVYSGKMKVITDVVNKIISL